MMTISNPEWSSSFEKTPYRVRLNIKSVLFLLSIFGFGFNLTAQKTGDLNDLEQFKSKWMTEHQIKNHTTHARSGNIKQISKRHRNTPKIS